MLNFSEASERNKQPIFDQISRHLTHGQQVLEIGSGSGQHALFFTSQLAYIRWQPTEQAQYVDALGINIDQHGAENVSQPFPLDVTRDWPKNSYDAIYSANTLHIMSWKAVNAFFNGAGQHVKPHGFLMVYGPFRYANAYTSQSNAAFDNFLRARDPESGIRDFEAIDALAQSVGFRLISDTAMPANNQLLIWQRDIP